MTVVQGWIAGENFVITGYGVDGWKGATTIASTVRKFAVKTKDDVMELLFSSLSLNSSAEEIVGETGNLVWKGNKTEHGILGFVKRFEVEYMKLRNAVPEKRKHTYPFSSSKKRMTTLAKATPGDQMVTMHVKGASELVVADCENVFAADGSIVPLAEDERKNILQIIEQMANQGNRTSAVAYAQLGPMKDFPDVEPQVPLTLLSILGIQDPIREEVPEAIALCRSAGIRVRMVTGDNINTAIAIAKKCGLYQEGDVAMQGRDFRKLASNDPDQLKMELQSLTVLARSSPTDKHLLVGQLIEMGEVVAVTGDGTNDAPALSLADVGFAMHSGTDVAKNASKMIMMDDNFATVVKATKWGRTVNENVKKFLQFQLTVNLCGVLLTFIGSAISEDAKSPLNAVQLLWLNLIMDTMAALALATERPSDACLQRPPMYRGGPLITWRMWSFVVIHGIYQLAWLMTLTQVGQKLFDIRECEKEDNEAGIWVFKGYCRGGVVQSTCIFNTFVLFQVFNQFNARRLYGEQNILDGMLSRAKWFWLIFLITVGFQVFAVEAGGKFVGTKGLNAMQWGICIGIALTEIPLGVLVRCLPIREWRPSPGFKQSLSKERKEEIDSMNKSIAKAPSEPDTPNTLSAPPHDDQEDELLTRFRRASKRKSFSKFRMVVESPEGDRSSLRYSFPNRSSSNQLTVAEQPRILSLRNRPDRAVKEYAHTKPHMATHQAFGN
eukprot:TRINITY_DN64360_c0_g1_i1.p1 TRINITY_DN64360_c0_g1~~TRINITY_DN64360_c0_g1_i1.p1  ORF type:complete len:734 (-),score=66.84 TRINITY_DN64360_c0_g1_i1:479-2647(-)